MANEKRLIDANRFLRETRFQEGVYPHKTLKMELDAQPTVEAVEVVRCKDCKHRDTVICPMSATYEDYPWKDTRDNDFCSYGERKDNG